jgi:hypothetical protein
MKKLKCDLIDFACKIKNYKKKEELDE